MSYFVRGARVGPKPAPPPPEQPLSFVEAALVMVDVAHRDGLTEERFIELMRKAYQSWKIARGNK